MRVYVCVFVCVCARVCRRGWWGGGSPDEVKVGGWSNGDAVEAVGATATHTHSFICDITATHCNTLQHTVGAVEAVFATATHTPIHVRHDSFINEMQHTAT